MLKQFGFEQLALKNVVYVNQLVGVSQLALEEIVELANYGIEQGLVLAIHLAAA